MYHDKDNLEKLENWLTKNFNLGSTSDLPWDEVPRIIYPDRFFGKRAFDYSLKTWLIQNTINAGNGRPSRRIRKYLADLAKQE